VCVVSLKLSDKPIGDLICAQQLVWVS